MLKQTMGTRKVKSDRCGDTSGREEDGRKFENK